MESEKEVLTFFKKCELDLFEKKDLFNFRYIINEELQNIKIYLIKNYSQIENRNSIEQFVDNINEIILEILKTDGKNLKQDLIYKIQKCESLIFDFLSCCKTW